MDKIKFIVEKPISLDGVDFKKYDVEVYLNEKKLPHKLFNAVEVLPVYKYRSAEFDMFTCSCGVPGCAGFQSPVCQSTKEGVVTWTFPETDDYTTDKKEYQFDKKEFDNEFIRLKQKMLNYEKKNIIHDTFIIDESIYSEEDNEGPRRKSNFLLKNGMNYYENIYQGYQNFNDMLEKNYPELNEKEFKYIYEGKEGKYSYSLGEVTCMLLNQYPSRSKEKKYLKSCEKAVDAIIDMLNGQNEKLKEIIYEHYEGDEISSYSLVRWDFSENQNEEDFDIEKLGLITY